MSRRFGKWLFGDDMSLARSDDGEEIRFTRQERLLLSKLMSVPRALVTRERLLVALRQDDHHEGEAGTRHVDYLINRLRRRLGDSAHAPQFIATHYGEGYSWIARPVGGSDLDAAVVIVPLHDRLPAMADTFVQALRDALEAQFTTNLPRPVAAVAPPAWTPDAGTRIDYLLELSAWADDEHLHMALMLRDAGSGAPLRPFRVTRPLAKSTTRSVYDEAAEMADVLQRHIWAHKTLPHGDEAPRHLPIELRLHEAIRAFGDPAVDWREAFAGLGPDAGHRRQPAVADLTQAMVLMTRIAMQSLQTECLGAQQWDAMEADIERLVLPNLPDIAGQPLLELAASRLLMATGGRHAATAFELARQGFAGTTAFATAFSTLAQCYAYQGEFARTQELYRRSIELAEHGSEFHVYLMVLQCIAHLGSADHDALARCRDQLFEIKPGTRQELGLWLYDSDTPLPDDLVALVSLIGEADLAKVLYMSQRKTVNFFGDPTHRGNCLRGFASHIARHRGLPALPPALQPLVRSSRETGRKRPVHPRRARAPS